ncbi:unnamed protein product [Meganyctiphanes norvegica]|uniref:tRNA (32-2'-O)-methyltransferase regulator THADA n=1 Tax=Meganyctiphanes norvegica TaxID=48144 RepID=A0AAV2Q459_MEGNR
MENDILTSLRLGPTVKGGKIRISNMEPLTLTQPQDSLSPLVHEAVDKLISPTGPQDQVLAIEKLLKCDMSDKLNKMFIIKIFIESLVQLNAKAQLRNKIMKGLYMIASLDWNSYEELMMGELLEVLKHPAAASGPTVTVLALIVDSPGLLLDKPPQHHNTKILDMEHESVNEGPIADETELSWHFHNSLGQAIIQSLDELWNTSFKNATSSVSANNTLQLLQTLVKSACKYIKQVDQQTHNQLHDNLEDLFQMIFHVLLDVSCPLDFRINCGQLYALLYSVINKRSASQLVLQVLNGEILCKESKEKTKLTKLTQLSIFNGILCNTHGAQLFSSMSEDGRGISEAIIQFGLTSGLQGNDGNVAISVSRLVQSWVLRAKDHSIFLAKQKDDIYDNDLKIIRKIMQPSSPSIQQLIEYLWLTWDHYLDSVKHMIKDIFQNFMKTEVTLFKDESKSFFFQICETLLSPSCCHKWRYSAVSIIVQSIGAQPILTAYNELPTQLLCHMKDHAQASCASELLETLFTVHSREVTTEIWQELWLSVFLDNYSQEMQVFGYDSLLKKLLILSPSCLNVALTTLLESQKVFKGNKLFLLILCAKIGRGNSTFKCKESNSKDENRKLWKNILPYMMIEFCLSNSDESIQMAAFNLLCESSKSTELFEKEELEILLDFFQYCLSNQSPTCRQQVIRGTKKIFSRIHEGIAALSHNKKRKENEVQHIIGFHKVFCESLFEQMLSFLHCGANFMRRGLALQILELFHNTFVTNSGAEFELKHMYQSVDVVDTLIYCLGDPYENNKIISLNLLLIFSKEDVPLPTGDKVKSLLDSAFEMASSCRPPDTLTASYIIKFLMNQPDTLQYTVTEEISQIDKRSCNSLMCKFIFSKLQAEVDIAKLNLFQCASSGPMYGLLSCLRMILLDVKENDFVKDYESWKSLLCEVIEMCFRISEIVAPVVRNDSPEGHLPMDLNPESLGQLKNVLQQSIGYHKADDDKLAISEEAKPEVLVKAQAVSAQMMLLCAWRSIKEISLLLGGLISTVPLPPQPYAILNLKEIVAIGKYFLTQMVEIKHRGAFEQTYVGFGKMCEKLWCCEDSKLKKLPEVWLTEVLDAINAEGSGGMCATRRSAGVPFIIQAILSSEPNINGVHCMNSTIKTLLKFSSNPQYDGTVQRVHSFNILRALYKETRLGDHIIPFVADGVKAAIQGFKSKTWAERNSATLLFAALITRMFGVKKTQDDLHKKNAMSAPVFFKRYPELYDFLQLELENGSKLVTDGELVPGLYPTLLLLARLAPTPVEGRNSAISMASFIPYVLQCAASSILQLRVLASHAVTPLVSLSLLPNILNDMCKMASTGNQNQLHGLLLCLKKLVITYRENIQASEALQRSLENIIAKLSWAATESNTCLITCNDAIKLVSEVLKSNIISITCPFIDNITKSCLNLVTYDCSQVYDRFWNLQLQHIPGATLCQQSATEYLLLDCIKVKHDIIQCLIRSPNYDVRLIALKQALKQNIKFSNLTTEFMNRLYEENHQECLILIHQILSRTIKYNALDIIGLNIKSIEDCMQDVMLKLHSETRMDVCSSMLDLLSVCLEIIIKRKSQSTNIYTVISEWVKFLLVFSTSEQPDNLRTVVVTSLMDISPLIKSSLSGDIRLQILEMILYFLQDSSHEIRQLAVKVAIGLLQNSSETKNDSTQNVLLETYNDLEPLKAIEIVCKGIAEAKLPKYLSLLVKVALQEEDSEVVGVGEDSERMFDKGEMNVFSEQLLLAHAATQALKQVLQTWSLEEKPMFDKWMIYPHILVTECEPKEESSIHEKLTDRLEDTLSLDQIITLLKEDMDIIFSQISSMNSKSLFSVRNLDLWILRLSCRSVLWTGITGGDKNILTEETKYWLQSKKEFLSSSSLKPYFVKKVIEDLS